MSLKDKQSLYDKNTYGILGNTPENTIPGMGNYFTDGGANDSPFVSQKGDDHMVSLLTRKVTSVNTGKNYNPSPNKSEFQDLNGNPGPQFQLGRAVASQKHIDSLTKTSTYTHGNSTEVVGPVPGGDSNSPFNDIKGDIVNNTGPSFADAGGAGKKLGGKDLHEALLTKAYTYNTDPGKSTTVLQTKGGNGGQFDLDGIDGGNGFFHRIADPQRFQGKTIGGKDLHEHLLEKSYTYGYGGGGRRGTGTVVIGPSPGPSGFSDFQDLPGAPRTTSPLGYKNPDTGVSF